MRQYSIKQKNGHRRIDWGTREAANPKEALKKAYTGFDIDIKPASMRNYTHCVELIDGSRKSESYYNVRVIKSCDRCKSRVPFESTGRAVEIVRRQYLNGKTRMTVIGTLEDLKIGRIIWDEKHGRHLVSTVRKDPKNENRVIVLVNGDFIYQRFYI